MSGAGSGYQRRVTALYADDVVTHEALTIVAEQAKDDGLWFDSEYITEAYLQQELRRLHAALEESQ